MRENVAKAELMLDLESFLSEFSDYSPDMENSLNERCRALTEAYMDLPCAARAINCTRIYVLRKHGEKAILSEYYRKIESDFFQRFASMLADDLSVPENIADDYGLPAFDIEGTDRQNGMLDAHLIVPFMVDLLKKRT